MLASNRANDPGKVFLDRIGSFGDVDADIATRCRLLREGVRFGAALDDGHGLCGRETPMNAIPAPLAIFNEFEG